MANLTSVGVTAGLGTSGTGTISTLDNLIGTAGAASAQVLSIQGIASGTALAVTNTNTLKPNYGASVAVTSTSLQSLANGATVFWSSAVIDNTVNLSDDEIITWVIKAGTSPTVNASIECWLWEILDDTPTYPDTITGSEAAVTLTSANVKLSGALKFAGAITVDNTTGRLYYNTFRLSQAFGSTPPKKWGIGVVNISGVALSASGNVVSRIPVQFKNS